MPNIDQTSPTSTGDEDVHRPRLALERYFTNGTHPFKLVQWEKRNAIIPGSSPDAPPSFEQKDVSFPSFWSQNATNIVAQKYFAGQLGTPEREHSVKQLIGRVVEKIGAEGMVGGYFADEEERAVFEHELAHILLHQMASFNSPVWFNIGVPGIAQQCSACFILHVDDHLSDILEWYKEEGLIFQNGSGAGLNLSNLRGSMEPLQRGGQASGPVTFMRGADASAGTITSGGRTRRAAKMVVLDADHPDVEDFIWCKANEEKKARALAQAGFDMSLNTEEGASNWASLQYQNANNSVRVSDAFMRAVENDGSWDLLSRGHEEVGREQWVTKTVSARELLRQIADATWQSADPGVQYDTTINDWHTCPNHSRITASNPCSEYLHVDDSSCNLASMNLMRFRLEDGSFDVEAFRHAVRVIFTAQEILISFADYPTEKIAHNTRAMRQVGIGFANLGAYLMSNGLPYDSDEGRRVAGAITAVLTGESYRQSAVIASRVGVFDEFENNREPMIRVLKKHRSAALKLEAAHTDLELTRAAKRVWREAVEHGERHGVRNAQASVLAPTGTISFMMDCDTTGIEPDFSLVKYKKLVGGGSMTIVNQTVPQALNKLGYEPHTAEAIVDFIVSHNTVIDAPGLQPEHYPIFACAVGANAIGYQGHIDMMAACQPFISGAISKTVNLPADVTVEDIMDVYTTAWHKGLKAVAIYRDGTKVAQPLADTKKKDAPDDTREHITSILGDGLLRGERRRLPLDRQVIGRHFQIGQVSGYIHAGLFEDGTPGDLFVTVAQAGSTLRGMIDTWAVTFSMALQHGTPLDVLVSKLAFTSFEPHGFTNDEEIRTAKSIVDYVVKWLAARFLDDSAHMTLGLSVRQTSDTGESDQEDTVTSEFVQAVSVHSPVRPAVLRSEVKTNTAGTGSCGKCGGLMVQTGKCMTCTSCGETGGCG